MIICGSNPKYFTKIEKDSTGNVKERHFFRISLTKGNNVDIEITTKRNKSVYKAVARMVRQHVLEKLNDPAIETQFKDIFEEIENRFAEEVERSNYKNIANVYTNLIKTEYKNLLPLSVKSRLINSFTKLYSMGVFDKPMAFAEKVKMPTGDYEYVPYIYAPYARRGVEHLKPEIVLHEFTHLLMDRILRAGALPSAPDILRNSANELRDYLSRIEQSVIVNNKLGKVVSKRSGKKSSSITQQSPTRTITDLPAGEEFSFSYEVIEEAVKSFRRDLANGELPNTELLLKKSFNADRDFILNLSRDLDIHFDLKLVPHIGIIESIKDASDTVKQIVNTLYNLNKVLPSISKDKKSASIAKGTLDKIYSFVSDVVSDLEDDLSILNADGSFNFDKIHNVSFLKEFQAYIEGFDLETYRELGIRDIDYILGLGEQVLNAWKQYSGEGNVNKLLDRINAVLSKYDKQYGAGLGLLSLQSQTGRYKLKKYFDEEIIPYFYSDTHRTVLSEYNNAWNTLNEYKLDELVNLADKYGLNLVKEQLLKKHTNDITAKSIGMDEKFILNQLKQLERTIPEAEDLLNRKKELKSKFIKQADELTKAYFDNAFERNVNISEDVIRLKDELTNKIIEYRDRGITLEQVVKEFLTSDNYNPIVLSIIETVYGMDIDENVVLKAKNIKSSIKDINDVKNIAKEFLFRITEMNEFSNALSGDYKDVYTHSVSIEQNQMLREMATELYGMVGGAHKLVADTSPELDYILAFRGLMASLLSGDRSKFNDNIFRYLINNALLSMKGLTANALGGLRTMQTIVIDYPIHKILTKSGLGSLADNLNLQKAVMNAIYNTYISVKTGLPVNELTQHIADIEKLSPEMSIFSVRYDLPDVLKPLEKVLNILGLGTRVNIATDEFYRSLITYFTLSDTVLSSNLTITKLRNPEVRYNLAKRLTEYVMSNNAFDAKTIADAYSYRRQLDNMLSPDFNFIDNVINDMRVFVPDDEFEGIAKSVILDHVLAHPNEHSDMFSKSINLSLYATGKKGAPQIVDKIITAVQNDPIARYFAMFIRTSTNFTLEGIRHTPIGFVLLPFKAWEAYKARGTSLYSQKAEILAHQISASLVGSTLMGILYSYLHDNSDQPVITGSYNWTGDPDFKPYSVRVGGSWYSYQNVMPYNTSLPLLVDFIQMASNIYRIPADSLSKVAGEVISSFMRYAISQTALRPLGDLVQYNNSVSMMTKSLAFPITTFLPRILYDMTYAKNREINIVDTKNLVNYIRSMTVRDTPPTRDEFGVEITSEITSDPAVDFILKMVLPTRNYRVYALDENISMFAEAVKQHNLSVNDIRGMWMPTGLDRNLRFGDISIPLNLEQYDKMYEFFNRVLSDVIGRYRDLYGDFPRNIEDLKNIYTKAKEITYSEARKNVLGLTEGMVIGDEVFDIYDPDSGLDESDLALFVREKLSRERSKELFLPSPAMSSELVISGILRDMGVDALPLFESNFTLPKFRKPSFRDLFIRSLLSDYLERYGEPITDEMFEF